MSKVYKSDEEDILLNDIIDDIISDYEYFTNTEFGDKYKVANNILDILEEHPVYDKDIKSNFLSYKNQIKKILLSIVRDIIDDYENN